ncbi:unnamed protein product [Trifolium pratense]|uniref:Uncharacterized protein n=1 Tax=Trifolium pratense TaxID=57577 RepID=A0ACB0L286_TRIPR|nr:unnamed protein product [Trifolium pratense]
MQQLCFSLDPSTFKETMIVERKHSSSSGSSGNWLSQNKEHEKTSVVARHV